MEKQKKYRALKYINGKHYDLEGNLVSVLDLLSPPRIEDAEFIEKFKTSTREEYLAFLKEKGYFIAGQNNSSTIDFRRT